MFFNQFIDLWNDIDSWLNVCVTSATFNILIKVLISVSSNVTGSLPHHWLLGIFPSLFHVQLNLHMSGELGQPPSTLPTVSNYRRHFNHYL